MYIRRYSVWLSCLLNDCDSLFTKTFDLLSLKENVFPPLQNEDIHVYCYYFNIKKLPLFGVLIHVFIYYNKLLIHQLIYKLINSRQHALQKKYIKYRILLFQGQLEMQH